MSESITVTNNQTGETREIPILNGGVAASEFSKVVPGVWFYDPGFMATASAESAITYLDGDAGILRYRGYPIEQLAEKSTFVEVAYLLVNGELPTAEQLQVWTTDIHYHTYIHENMRKRFFEGFHYDAHPMGMLIPLSRRSRRSTRNPRISMTGISCTSRLFASSPRCPLWPPPHTDSQSACRSSTPTTI